MLTKDLLLYRIRGGQVHPAFVERNAPDLLALGENLVAMAAAGAGKERGVLEEEAAERLTGFPRPRVAAGMVKLLFDRMVFEESTEEATALRQGAFDASATVLRNLQDNATREDFERALTAAAPSPLDELRARLYSDHPENRKLLSWEPVEPPALIDRYNMAQVQGLVLRARRVGIRAEEPELLRLRRLLRWLKFFRLVPDARMEGNDLVLDVEGPATILAMGKKYGLQLAQFVAMVPVLQRWQLRAEIELTRQRTVTLALDERSGLVTQDRQGLGYVPQEIEVILGKLADGPWLADPTPLPRPVGATGLCVPDIAFRKGAREIALEFFHPWHRHALERRLDDIRMRADPSLILGVDEKLLDDELRPRVAEHPQVFLFKGFPSERGLRALLQERLG